MRFIIGAVMPALVFFSVSTAAVAKECSIRYDRSPAAYVIKVPGHRDKVLRDLSSATDYASRHDCKIKSHDCYIEYDASHLVIDLRLDEEDELSFDRIEDAIAKIAAYEAAGICRKLSEPMDCQVSLTDEPNSYRIATFTTEKAGLWDTRGLDSVSRWAKLMRDAGRCKLEEPRHACHHEKSKNEFERYLYVDSELVERENTRWRDDKEAEETLALMRDIGFCAPATQEQSLAEQLQQVAALYRQPATSPGAASHEPRNLQKASGSQSGGHTEDREQRFSTGIEGV